jgi:peptidyl-prolyl cis-trans isomerase SurA
MRRAVLACSLIIGAAANAAAQATPPRLPSKPAPVVAVTTEPKANPVDRIVAVVGTKPMLWSEILEQIYADAAGKSLPTDSAAAMQLAHVTLDRMIDQEVLIASAKLFKIDVPDAELQESVDKRYKDVRTKYKTDAELRDALRGSGFGTETEFRKYMLDQARREELQKRAVDSLRARGRLSAPVAVTEDEVTEAFERAKGNLQKRPATVAFRQIVVRPEAKPGPLKAARERAESLIVELGRKGVDFETVAKRESMDPTTKDVGGDLGWNRRDQMVPEFDRMMFALPPGVISPVPVKTSFGYHVIKVDRVQPGEVKARHILIVPTIDSQDVAWAKLRADTVLAKWKATTPFDSLVGRYHDPAEVRSALEGVVTDELPAEYKAALGTAVKGDFVGPFAIPDPRSGKPKYVVMQIINRTEGGDFTVADYRDKIRTGLKEEKQYRRLIDQLRREQFVQIKF